MSSPHWFPGELPVRQDSVGGGTQAGRPTLVGAWPCDSLPGGSEPPAVQAWLSHGGGQEWSHQVIHAAPWDCHVHTTYSSSQWEHVNEVLARICFFLFICFFLWNPALVYLYLQFVHIYMIICVLWYLVLHRGKTLDPDLLAVFISLFYFVFLNSSGLTQMSLWLYKEIKFCTYIIKNHIFNICSLVSAVFSLIMLIRVAMKL